MKKQKTETVGNREEALKRREEAVKKREVEEKEEEEEEEEEEEKEEREKKGKKWKICESVWSRNYFFRAIRLFGFLVVWFSTVFDLPSIPWKHYTMVALVIIAIDSCYYWGEAGPKQVAKMLFVLFCLIVFGGSIALNVILMSAFTVRF